MTLILALVALAYALPEEAVTSIATLILVMFITPYLVGALCMIVALPALLVWDGLAYGSNRLFGTHWPRVGEANEV